MYEIIYNADSDCNEVDGIKICGYHEGPCANDNECFGNLILNTQTAAENLIPVVKTTQAPRPVALTCTNVILAKETVKMTVTVLEFSYVAITIVETIFRMGRIVVNNQVPQKEVSF